MWSYGFIYCSASFLFLKVIYFVLFLIRLSYVWVLRNWSLDILFNSYVLLETNLWSKISNFFFVLILNLGLLEISVLWNYIFVLVYIINIFSCIIRYLRRCDMFWYFFIWLISWLGNRSYTINFWKIIVLILV